MLEPGDITLPRMDGLDSTLPQDAVFFRRFVLELLS